MVFILYKLYVLLPYTYPTPKLSPHRRRCISTFPQKTHSVWFISILNYGDTENVLINHLLLVIPMSYPCHYTNLCPHKPHKHAHTHTHTHTRIQDCHFMYWIQLSIMYYSVSMPRIYCNIQSLIMSVSSFIFLLEQSCYWHLLCVPLFVLWFSVCLCILDL